MSSLSHLDCGLESKERVCGRKTKLLPHSTLLVDEGGFEDEDRGGEDKYENEGEGQLGFREETLKVAFKMNRMCFLC